MVINHLLTGMILQVSTHLKNMLVKLDHFSTYFGVNKN